MNPLWKWYLPGYVMLSLHTFLGFLLSLVYYRATNWVWHGGYWTCIPRRALIGGKWVGAQTWGNIIFCRDERQRSRQDLMVHEVVHVAQGMWLGPLAMLLYGLHFLVLLPFSKDWKAAYYKIWAEKMAYRIQDEFKEGKRPGAWGSNDA